jgi:hypothetical protein
MPLQRTAVPESATPPTRPTLCATIPSFVALEREAELEGRTIVLAALQRKVDAAASHVSAQTHLCGKCGQRTRLHDTRTVSWVARCGSLHAPVARFRCPSCRQQCRPLLDQLGVEPGRISGALARSLAVLAAVVPYPLAARLAELLLGVHVSAMGVWRVAQRLGQAAAQYSDDLSRYHADSRSIAALAEAAQQAVVVSVDGCSLGMQVRAQRRRRTPGQPLPPLPAVEQGHFREVKTGVLLLPAERVETSPGRRTVVRRFLVSCLGDADTIFAHLYARLRELGWVGTQTVVVIVGDGAEWIWNRASMFVKRCEILDFWHAVEHAWAFARLRYGEGSVQADQWVHQVAEDLRTGKVQDVIARLKRMRPQSAEVRESLQSLIRYYSENAGRMRYDEYLRLGYGIGSGAVESAHKQVVHARLRQAGMRWSEAGARHVLALRLLLLNGDWAVLDRLRMVSLA